MKKVLCFGGSIALFLLIISTQATIYAKGLKVKFFGSFRETFWQINEDSMWNYSHYVPNPISSMNSSLLLSPEGEWNYKKMFIKGAISFTINEEGESQWTIRESYIKHDLGDFEISVGRNIVDWGTGYIRNPIGVIAPQKNISDTEDLNRSKQGIDLAKINFYKENVYFSLANYKNHTWRNFALLGYTNIKGIDLYGVVNYPESKKSEVGLAFALTVGQSFEFHGEWLWQRQKDILYHQLFRDKDPNQTYISDPVYFKNENYLNHLLMGFNLTLKNWNYIVEYYHRDDGLSSLQWKLLKKHFSYHNALAENPVHFFNAQRSLIFTQETFLVKDYLFIRCSKTFPKSQASVVSLVNLYDWSYLLLFNLDFQLVDDFTIFFYPGYFGGKPQSQFRELCYSHFLEMGIRISF